MSFWSTARPDLATSTGQLGPLERRVLEALWTRETPATVRDLTLAFPDAAYTTLMTTLDRLYRKGVLARRKTGRAFEYQPRLARSAFEHARAADAFRQALDRTGGSLAPLVSCLIDAVGDRDRELLDELEALVSARRGADREPR
jgi:predicted transcriptional regulator